VNSWLRCDGKVLSVLAAAAFLVGCRDSDTAGKAKPLDFAAIDVGVEKALLYNLVGRWFPVDEVERLRGSSMTAADWCQRPPTMVSVDQESVIVQCSEGDARKSAIGSVKREAGPSVSLFLRNSDTRGDTVLRFRQVTGQTALLEGVDCQPDRPILYRRFPEFEILERQILGGRQCAQYLGRSEDTSIAPDDE
jgi:hypothetical protein